MNLIFHNKIEDNLELILNCNDFAAFKINFCINRNIAHMDCDFYKIIDNTLELTCRKMFSISELEDQISINRVDLVMESQEITINAAEGSFNQDIMVEVPVVVTCQTVLVEKL